MGWNLWFKLMQACQLLMFPELLFANFLRDLRSMTTQPRQRQLREQPYSLKVVLALGLRAQLLGLISLLYWFSPVVVLHILRRFV